MNTYRRIFGIFGLAILLAPLAVAAVPITALNQDDEGQQGWWTETTVDRNQNKIGDMVELHMDNPIFLDDANTLPLIIDFYYTPGDEEIKLLEIEVDYEHQFTLHGIDALVELFAEFFCEFSSCFQLLLLILHHLDDHLTGFYLCFCAFGILYGSLG